MEIQRTDEREDKPRCSSRPKSYIFGLLVLLFGVLLLMRNTGVIDREVWRIFFSWEMLLIAIGLINLFDRSRPLGIILIMIGSIFLIPDVFHISMNIHHVLWPAVLIVIGLFIIFGHGRRKHQFKVTHSETTDDRLDETVVFGGTERMIITPAFRGGEIVNVFGGSKINLTQSKLADEVQVLEVTCVFGGTTLIVPPDWNIKIETTQIFGGFSDKRGNIPVDHSKTLIIKGVTIFGGGELKLF